VRIKCVLIWIGSTSITHQFSGLKCSNNTMTMSPSMVFGPLVMSPSLSFKVRLIPQLPELRTLHLSNQIIKIRAFSIDNGSQPLIILQTVLSTYLLPPYSTRTGPSIRTVSHLMPLTITIRESTRQADGRLCKRASTTCTHYTDML